MGRLGVMEHWLGEFLILLTTVDPIGTLTLYLAVIVRVPESERFRVAVRAVAYAAGILVVFIVAGQIFLTSIGIRMESFELAGGLILFMFGVQMVFGTGAATAGAVEEGHDIAVFPLAIPSIANPGSILAVVTMTDNRQFSIVEQAMTTGLLLLVLGLTLAMLAQADRIGRRLGKAGANLLVRVMGLVLSGLAVEMVVVATVGLMPA